MKQLGQKKSKGKKIRWTQVQNTCIKYKLLEVDNILGFEFSNIQIKDGKFKSYKINNDQKRKTY